MQKKSTREARRKLVARIMAGVLAFLMIGGTAYSMIYMLFVSAAEPVYEPTEDLNIRVGLMYGDGVTVGFETEAPAGYTVGVQPLKDGYFEFTPFGHLANTTVTVAADANLTKKDRTYSITSGTTWVAVGGYHVEFATDYSIIDMPLAQAQVQTLNDLLAPFGMYAFPTYIHGVIRIRVGHFVSRAQAEAQYPFIAGFMSGFVSTVVEPSTTAVTVLDPVTDRILMEYDGSDDTALGLSAADRVDASCYIKTPAKNVYDGVFAYSRYQEEGIDGVAVTNVLTLDEYVEGVVPYEVSGDWPLEALKAFSIAVRSYAASTLRRHEASYHFDLCNGTHCQVYKGAGRVNDNVIAAALQTHGQIITHQGEIATAFFSSSVGGVTVSIGDVWGGASYPYLVAHDTPWERYSEHRNGFWTVEVSPHELLKYLREQKGYTELHGSIASIQVLQLAPNSDYVYRLRISDIYGNHIDLDHTDHIRMALTSYVKSANFVVGKGSVQYTVDTVTDAGTAVLDTMAEKLIRPPVSGVQPTQIPTVLSNGLFSVLTADSLVDIAIRDAKVLTADGLVVSDGNDIHVLSGGAQYHLTDTDVSASIPGTATVREYAVTTETKTAVASSPQNFIFVGKGYGHGAGMSQYGTKDLADLGYDYEHIINAYYTDVEIVYYKYVKELQS